MADLKIQTGTAKTICVVARKSRCACDRLDARPRHGKLGPMLRSVQYS
jgi:hypothetical protein